MTIILVVFAFVAGIYILARLASIAEQSKWDELTRLREEARRRRINMLYGRYEDEE